MVRLSRPQASSSGSALPSTLQTQAQQTQRTHDVRFKGILSRHGDEMVDGRCNIRDRNPQHACQYCANNESILKWYKALTKEAHEPSFEAHFEDLLLECWEVCGKLDCSGARVD